jgi:hypothetical protein
VNPLETALLPDEIMDAHGSTPDPGERLAYRAEAQRPIIS